MHTGHYVDVNPLGGEEKLEEEDEDVGVSSNVDVDNLEITDSVHMAEEDGNSCPVGEHGPEAPVQQPGEFTMASENRVEADILGVNFHHDGPVCEPRSGLEFETKEAAYSFYRQYARSVGFGITIKASRRSKKSGKFIDVKIACSRFGIKRECDTALNPRSCPKTDCKAGMHMKRREDGIWVIHSFVKEHNHEICPDDFYQSIRGANKLGAMARPKKGLQLALSEEDVQVMLENFVCMQDENPNFFYAIDLDHGKRLRNVLWVDPKGSHDYSSFCDVVFFDTFYVSNRYHLPFVPIVGVNNHFQYILLGCALIGNQTASTYSWVMQTWLRAVGGTSPRVILTDQDKSLEEAVAEVFPESRHCFCLWHVLRMIPGNLGVVDKHENFRKEFDKCVHQSFTVAQFENQWEKLVSRFELGEDDWVRSLYEDRTKWVPAYMQGIFLAGISTAARSKGILTSFDKYICRETKIKEFMEKCRTYLQERYEMEAEANAEARGKQPPLKSVSPFEKQMSKTYTSTIFKQFQDEVLGVESCHLQRDGENEANGRFQVRESGEDRSFILHWNEKHLDICCSCRSFEYRGFLCRHAMIVLHTLGISSIPPQYILKRWTKDAKSRQTFHDKSSGHSSRLQRFNDLCRRAIKLGQEASFSQEAYDVAYQSLQEALRHCVGVNDSVRTVSEPSSTAIPGSFYTEENQGSMPGQSKKKRKYKKRKLHGEVEQEPGSWQQEPSSMNSRVEEISSCDASSVKDVPVTTSNAISERINEGSSLQPQGGPLGDPPDAEDAEPLNTLPPIRGPYYINFSAGVVHVNPMLTQVGHFDIPTAFKKLYSLSDLWSSTECPPRKRNKTPRDKRSAYAMLTRENIREEEVKWKLIWKWRGPQRIRSFLWLVGHERLLMNVHQRSRGITSNDLCAACNSAAESNFVCFDGLYGGAAVMEKFGTCV
ncbi:protein FAR1-RELATED SEQUENCE 2-like isoform X1 [Punica granatum]|uniref:Protein FAR1-RELATED SEQUENCE n=1 Tax=Punica granatum TaxID=22663 RepID=A0A6P8C466_PUNGR|nr:protein FAR1-RELATED SEQUENCE 2-like isoform X1 [Punica granatum]